MTATVTRIVTHYAIMKRAQNIIKEIDKMFEDGESWGLTLKEIDPDEQMLNIRRGLIAMLEREKQIGRVKP